MGLCDKDIGTKMKGFPPSNFGTIWASQRLMSVIEYKHWVNKNLQVYPMFKIFKRKKRCTLCSGMHIEGMGFSHGSAVKNLPANAGDTGDMGSIPGSGRSPGGGNGNLLQYLCLKTPMNRGVWQATVCGVTTSQIWLSNWGQIGVIIVTAF